MAASVESLLVRHRLDVDDYHRMGDAGILGEHDRVELIGVFGKSETAAFAGQSRP
jgi:hypothetical protein